MAIGSSKCPTNGPFCFYYHSTVLAALLLLSPLILPPNTNVGSGYRQLWNSAGGLTRMLAVCHLRSRARWRWRREEAGQGYWRGFVLRNELALANTQLVLPLWCMPFPITASNVRYWSQCKKHQSAVKTMSGGFLVLWSYPWGVLNTDAPCDACYFQPQILHCLAMTSTWLG